MRKNNFTGKWAVLLVALVMVVLQAGPAWSWFGGSKKKATEDGMMPSFTLSSAVDGAEVNSDSLLGTVLLVNFWATWCGPCVEEYPDLMRLQKAYGDQGFSVIGISTDQGRGVVVKFVEKYGHNYPMLMTTSAVTRSFGAGIGLPVSFLVDRRGKIAKRYYGPRSFEQFAADIAGLL